VIPCLTATIDHLPAPASAAGSFGVVSVFHRAANAGGKIFEAWEKTDQSFLRGLLSALQNMASPGKLRLSTLCFCFHRPKGDAPVKTFDFLGMAFSRDGLCALGGTTPDRVREMTSQVYDRIARAVRQGSWQASKPRPSQAEFLRRVETYRQNWPRYLKGILAGFHQHRGAQATGALYALLCEQHRQLSSPQQWVTLFPLPRWRGWR
jgi:hypothetical protein